MIYSVRLKITHNYNQTATNGRHLIRVSPKMIPERQHLTTHLLEITPEPDAHSETTDFFGNMTTTCVHSRSHKDMEISLACHVEMTPLVPWQDTSPPARDLRVLWSGMTDLGADSPLHFLGPSPRLNSNGAITEFAKAIYRSDDSAALNVIQIGQALFDAMTFDGDATNVDTDPAEAFRLKRGVCQDFTHIMILALQAVDIPAGYVSGFLRTRPPEGGVRLEGADAMHAWVRAWCGPVQGWIEYDPTNATLVGTDHIVVGYGRDYGDLPPVSGHLRSSGGQRNAQAVDVVVVG
ncbi:MAG: transglutaminase family protein [Paracoccaceae bacterium]